MNVLKRLKKTSVTRSKRLWYTRKKEMRKNILAALQVHSESEFQAFLESLNDIIQAYCNSKNHGHEKKQISKNKDIL